MVDRKRTKPSTPGHVIGYARVSTEGQDLALQIDALESAGATRIFQDVASGAKAERPGLDQALDYLREGDVLAVWRLDRLGRSLPHLVSTVAALEARGVGFRSLTESIDTSTANGRLVFHLFGVVCGRGRNPTLRLWPTIFSGKIDVFPGDRRSRLISSMTSVAPA
ncbi:recombinase family protein [Pseudomonas aeruginosa]|uniref:recombinase family protein n=1 Tax=Pseudomonas aeruginosa TaxID=287 RepID=UPI0009AB4B6E